ncbi:MAG TPA: hypothetical protein VM537_25925 [Anaerolineae bacterium]|nr:hypothetical protein [Anaerolineae bacterium]
MAHCEVIDGFPAFLGFWDQVRQEPTDRQVEGWATQYMSHWPELLVKQQEDYASQNVDWRQIARERVFPFLDERLPAMTRAHAYLVDAVAPLYTAAQGALGFQSEAVFVLYVGIGCGAGWVTTLGGLPAILYGLENIAECGWLEAEALDGLVAHETGHLAHAWWREQAGKGEGSGPFWQLYSEGFAQRCEHLILGQDTWHQSTGLNGPGWLDWCHDHKGCLAAEFLSLAETQDQAAVRPFFGSWYDIRGWKECGYYLGHEVVRELETGLSLQQIGLLDDIDDRMRRLLEGMVSRVPPAGEA